MPARSLELQLSVPGSVGTRRKYLVCMLVCIVLVCGKHHVC